LLTLWPPALGPTVQERVLRFFVRHCPPCVYPLTTWSNHMWPNLPGLPPLYLHTASDQILEVGTAWEWGYVHVRVTWVYLTVLLCILLCILQESCSDGWFLPRSLGHQCAWSWRKLVSDGHAQMRQYIAWSSQQVWIGCRRWYMYSFDDITLSVYGY